MLNSYKAYIFDVDGTILDTAPCILNSITKTLKWCNVDFSPSQITSNLIGPKIGEIVDMLGIKVDTIQKDNIVKTFRMIYDENPIEKTRFYPQMQSLLRELQKKEVKFFIATNKPLYPLKKLLNHFSLNCFEEIYTPDKYIGKTMTKAEMIAEILKNNNLTPETTLFIGDTQGDYEASSMNNCPFAFASWGYAKDKDELCKKAKEILN